MSWKITQPEDGFLVKRVELGWTCNTCARLSGDCQEYYEGTYGVASDRPIRSISNPPGAVLLVPVDKALSQAFGVSLTTF